MAKKMLVGNWKMNLSIEGLSSYFNEFKSLTEKASREDTEVLFAVPFTLLSKARELLAGSNIQVAAQNVHWEKNGAFTGEVSIEMLKELGVKWTLVGHSERRQYFNESDETVAKKIQACLKREMQVIFCVGENLLERKSEETKNVIKKQLASVFEKIESIEGLVFAYEPVWAIGTGLAASAQQAQEVHKYIRNIISEKYGEKSAQEASILYGGSMKPENTRTLLSEPDINGGLVGGASLKAKDFASMLCEVSKL